jgi:predicted small secreted protein
MVKKIAACFLGSIFLLGLIGCNTMEGAGKDMEHAGEKIQDKADSNK